LVITLIAAIGLLGVGMIFSSSFSASQVAGQARALHWTNATLGTMGISRAAVTQAVFFAFDTDIGESDAKLVAISEAREGLAAVESLRASPDAPSTLVEPIAEFLDAAYLTIDLAEAGNPSEAERTRLTVVEPAFENATRQLGDRQIELAELIARSEASAGKVARLTQLAITLILPAVAMVVFWLTLRRRVKRDEATMRARVEAERKINREKDEFIAGLSHELRTPLTAIYGFSELLLGDESLPGDASELVGLINAGSADLSRMVDDLLAAARLDAEALTSRPERVDLSEQAELVGEPYRRTGENIEIKVPSIEVYADPVHVRQIIHNLISNARRHGGDEIVISGKVQNNMATLVIADDGEGVSQQAHERLFERFSNRGREALVTGSVGLGLAISQELAMRMSGVIRYERVGRWTIFLLQLPVMPSVERAETDEPIRVNVGGP
jgi:signal transduction histidine kinase